MIEHNASQNERPPRRHSDKALCPQTQQHSHKCSAPKWGYILGSPRLMPAMARYMTQRASLSRVDAGRILEVTVASRCRDEKTGAWRPLTRTPFSEDRCNATQLFGCYISIYATPIINESER